MACTRSRLRTWVNRLRTSLVILSLVWSTPLWAAVASQFSLLLGEQYSDNIFFSKDKEHDFVSVAIPSLRLLYAPSGQVTPTLNINVSAAGEVYARHRELNNFGENVHVDGRYVYNYSPRLRFDLFDTFQRQGSTRLSGFGGFGQLESNLTAPPPVGAALQPVVPQNLKDLISEGDQLGNLFTLQASFLYRPNISLNGGYTNTYNKFIDAGGRDLFHTVHTRAVYAWRPEHNLHAGYSVSQFDTREGDSGSIHNFDLGDDYFTNYNVQLTPTLSLSASSGLSFNASGDGPRIANNTSIIITKLWQTAQLNAGVRKGLTPSFGVAGISDTTAFFGNFSFSLSERLLTHANASFSIFDTDDVKFKTFQAGMGLEYLFTSWLSSRLVYFFNWRDGGSGANRTDLLEKGIVTSNNILLGLTMRFDLWPRIGLARSIIAPSLTPITTPFATTPFTRPGTGPITPPILP